MASEKKSEILKIGVFILIVIGSFLMFPEIGYGCTVKKNMDCTDGQSFGCGFCLEGDNGWICGIKMTPDSYYCQYAPEAIKPGECSNADVWLKQDACPDTNLHNGEKCVFADGSREGLNIHCHSKDGNWNGADKACVQCSGKTRATLLADTSKRCWNLTDSTWEKWPVGSTCANDYAGKCDYGCGASLECNHVDNAVGVAVPGGVCNNCVFAASGPLCVPDHCNKNCPPSCDVTQDPDCGCENDDGCCGIGCTPANDSDCAAAPPPPQCSWQNDACGQIPCSVTERHQTCVPVGCSGGVCTAGQTQCVADPLCAPLPTAPFLFNPLACNTFSECIEKIINFLLWIAIIITPLMIIVAGFLFLTSGGDPEKVRTAKRIIFWTVIGLAIILLAKGIISVIKQVIGG